MKLPPETVKLNDKLSGSIEDIGTNLVVSVGCHTFSYDSVKRLCSRMEAYRQRIIYYSDLLSTHPGENSQGDGI